MVKKPCITSEPGFATVNRQPTHYQTHLIQSAERYFPSTSCRGSSLSQLPSCLLELEYVH
jgi:hypothetical protein